MILVLEGINGAGKTHLAQQLSRETGWPVFRPFRRDGRDFNQSVAGMRALGIPVNSYIEDFFVAEAVGRLAGHAILDRSLPSAIAYGTLYREFSRTEAELSQWLDLWQDSLLQSTGPVLYLFLWCSFQDSLARCRHEKFPLSKNEDWLHVAHSLEWSWDQIQKLNRMMINTSANEAEQTLEMARRFLTNGHSG